MSAVDPRFQQARRQALQRRRKSLVRRLALGGGLVAALGLGIGLWQVLSMPQPQDAAPHVTAQNAANSAGAAPTANLPASGPPVTRPPENAASALTAPDSLAAGMTPDIVAPDPDLAEDIGDELRASLDLPGDPMLLVLGNSTAPHPKRLPRPDTLTPTRGQGDVLLIEGPLLPPGERLALALPSSQEDFAIFQGQRQGMRGVQDTAIPAAALSRAPRSVAEARVWVAVQARTPGARVGAGNLILRPAGQRTRGWRDLVLLVGHGTDLEELLTLEGVSGLQAAAAARAAAQHLGTRMAAAGTLLALRLMQENAGPGQRPQDQTLVQMALYDGDRYLGAFARHQMSAGSAHAGSVQAAALHGASDATPPAAPGDMSFAPASDPWLQQDLPARLSGRDTQASAAPAPRVMDALYDAGLRHGLPPGVVGQIIMLLAQTHKLDVQARPEDRITLIRSAYPATPASLHAMGQIGGQTGGQIPPAAGTASPIGGGPIGGGQGVAAGNGAEDGLSDLDQMLFIGLQADGVDLRCYLYRPGPGRPPSCYGERRGSGPAVSATAGGSGVAAAPADVQALTASDAVEQLVNRIIQVESAGRADARNPLSTATGLGQFIDSTWLRMMRTYRPDLTARLSRAELLALRTDPEISRAMVLNLAREGESYLRARGHEITAGRLYLAHFLGMDGAHTALSAHPGTDLLALFGAGVVNANPFLRGRDAGYVVDWAEAKMRGASGRIAVIREPAGLAEFRALIDALLAQPDPI